MRPRPDAPRNRRLRTDKAPQQQCRGRDGHLPHHFGGPGGLIWHCQGRGRRADA